MGHGDKIMNLDFIQIAKPIESKDTINFQYLEKNAMYKNAERYIFDRCTKIEVWYIKDLQQIKIKGSLPYWIKGHNYYSSLAEWKEALDYMGGCLGINLYSGIVEKLEFGTIKEIPFTVKSFLKNHIKIKGMESRDFFRGQTITGKQFENPALKVKLYDVNRNIKNKLSKAIQEDLRLFHGWDKNKPYIKLENHYKKPEALNNGRFLYLADMLSNDFQNRLKEDLINTYKSIMKTGNSIIPNKKADINAGTLPLLVLKELEEIHNFKTEDLIKQKIQDIPEEILSISDKKARQRIIKENLKKITLSGKSEFDISKLLTFN